MGRHITRRHITRRHISRRHVRYTIDSSVRRVGAGTVLIGGSPLKLFRLTDRGALLLDSVERGEAIASTPASAALVDRLLDAGVLHPVVEMSSEPPDGPDSPATIAEPTVTVIIPVYNFSEIELTRLVAQARRGDHHDIAEVIIVDDASRPPIGEVADATTIRRETNGGPAAARSTGLDGVTTAYVAFVDTDVELTPNWLQPLLAYFNDERVALVAPRVASVDGLDIVSRYEATRSPLDLGTRPARVRAGTRVSYVPAAVMVCRVSALHEVGGFDKSMRVGEDVDLVWRLDEAGWRVRYDPTVTVTHHPRPSLCAWMKQRHDYGRSAAPLAARHPGALAPVRISGWSAATWLAIAAGWPIVGGIIAASTTALLARKLRSIPGGAHEALRLAGLGHLFAGRSLASVLTRAWWPLATVAALLSKRARRVLFVAAIAPATVDWVHERPSIDLGRYIGMRLLDDMAYGAGLADGATRARSLSAYKPDFTSWPRARKSGGEQSARS